MSKEKGQLWEAMGEGGAVSPQDHRWHTQCTPPCELERNVDATTADDSVPPADELKCTIPETW